MKQELVHSPARVLQQLWINSGYGGDPEVEPMPAWPVWASDFPSEPDEIMVFSATQGLSGGRLMHGDTLDKHGVQLMIRSSEHDVGWRQARKMREKIKGVYWQTVSLLDNLQTIDYQIQSIVNIGQIISLGKEAPTSHRRVFTINALVCIRQQTVVTD